MGCCDSKDDETEEKTKIAIETTANYNAVSITPQNDKLSNMNNNNNNNNYNQPLLNNINEIYQKENKPLKDKDTDDDNNGDEQQQNNEQQKPDQVKHDNDDNKSKEKEDESEIEQINEEQPLLKQEDIQQNINNVEYKEQIQSKHEEYKEAMNEEQDTKEYKIIIQPPKEDGNNNNNDNDNDEYEDEEQQEQDDIDNVKKEEVKQYKIVIDEPKEQQYEEQEAEEKDEEEEDEDDIQQIDDIGDNEKDEMEHEEQENNDNEDEEEQDELQQNDEEQPQSEPEQESNEEVGDEIDGDDDEEKEEEEEDENEEEDDEEYKIDDIDIIFERLERKKDDNKNMRTSTAFKRIVIILRDYKEWMNAMDNNDNDNEQKIENKDINEILNRYKNYNLSELLNDFYFLLYSHRSDIEFENMYNNICSILQCKPSIDECSSIKRNQRDRSLEYDKQINTLFYGINDVQQIIAIQILDNIYCYFLHSFDILFKLLSNEKLQIEEQIKSQQEDEDEVDEKDEINVTDIHLLETSRFVADFQTFSSIRGEDRLKNNKFYTNIKDKKFKNFAPMFTYWKEQQHETMYVAAKYDTLKIELTTNNMSNIDIKQWDELYGKAQIYISTNHCKQNIKPNKTMFADIYDINYKSGQISIEHLIAINVYCNFDVLQLKFAETFLKETRSEEIDDVIARHSSFAIFARLLRECVEVFGTALDNKCKYNRFYHGINRKLTLFNKSFSRYCGPLSTSTNSKVILNFILNNKGLIIELNQGRKDDAFYFDCNWISDHLNEDEKLFFLDGGHRSDVNTPINGQVIRIKSLLNVSLGHNYSIYVTALEVIRHLMEGQNYYSDLKNNRNNLDKQTKDIVYKLLTHQMYKENKNKNDNNNIYKEFKTIPKYIDNVLDSLCYSRKQIFIDWIQMNEETQNKFLYDLLCINNDEEDDMMGFIDINTFQILFPSLTKIEIRYIFLSDTIIYNIFDHITNSDNKLKEITIRDPGQQSLSISQALKQYADKFEEKDYNMYQWEGDSGMLKYLTFQNIDAAYDDSGDEPSDDHDNDDDDDNDSDESED